MQKYDGTGKLYVICNWKLQKVETYNCLECSSSIGKSDHNPLNPFPLFLMRLNNKNILLWLTITALLMLTLFL